MPLAFEEKSLIRLFDEMPFYSKTLKSDSRKYK
jgi:hypothetical protein